MSDQPRQSLARFAAVRGDGCPDDDRLAAYVRRRLTADQRADVDAHLQTCPACINRLIDTMEIEAAATSALPERLQARVRDSVNARLSGASPADRRPRITVWRNWLDALLAPRALTAAAAAALALAVTVGVLVRTPLDDEPDLTPRGQPSAAALTQLQEAVTEDGVWISEGGSTWLLRPSPATTSGIEVAPAGPGLAAPPVLPTPALAAPPALRVGTTLFVVPARGDIAPARVERLQAAQWQDADGGAHDGQLLVFGAAAAAPGAALVTADLHVAAVCVDFDSATSRGVAVPVEEILQEISRTREKTR